jgi:hypothetical protein
VERVPGDLEVSRGVSRAGRVLLLAGERWVSTARLALALESFGCEVGLLAQRAHPAIQAGVVARSYPYDVLRPVESILRAIRASQPDVLIPVDELTVLHLEELRVAAESGSGDGQESVRALLVASGSRAETMALGRSRVALLELAGRLGAPVPDTIPVASEQELAAAIGTLGLPLALKADATFGGRGVRLVSTETQALRSWRILHGTSSLIAALRRGMVWSEWGYVREWAHGVTRDVAAQRLVHGKERTAMAVAIEGELKAVVCLEVVQTAEYLGPSSVLRIVDDAAMVDAIRRVAKGANLSGFCGFDFIVDDVTGTPLLIEMNLRPTQLVHLPLGPGRDLIAAYLRGMLGLEIEDRPAATDQELIALFPQEVERDPHSEWARNAYLDVPWSAPELVRAALNGKVPRVIAEDVRYSASR